jgi:hypothetical protein
MNFLPGLVNPSVCEKATRFRFRSGSGWDDWEYASYPPVSLQSGPLANDFDRVAVHPPSAESGEVERRWQIFGKLEAERNIDGM